jgi:uncharacterized protein with HEPN domain
MQPDERDAGYLWDMLDSAKTVEEFTRGVSYHQYQQEELSKDVCIYTHGFGEPIEGGAECYPLKERIRMVR